MEYIQILYEIDLKVSNKNILNITRKILLYRSKCEECKFYY